MPTPIPTASSEADPTAAEADDSADGRVPVIDCMPTAFREFLAPLNSVEQCTQLTSYIHAVVGIAHREEQRVGKPARPPIEFPWLTDEDLLRWAAAVAVLHSCSRTDTERAQAALDAVVTLEWEISIATSKVARTAFHDRVRRLMSALTIGEEFSKRMAALDKELERRTLSAYGALIELLDALEAAHVLVPVATAEAE